ncbi:hypothetical protein GS421_06945 [Rhodococcus hoagii]|nr:hypothetical protein [Prescottella equi]
MAAVRRAVDAATQQPAASGCSRTGVQPTMPDVRRCPGRRESSKPRRGLV